ncbi:cytochrome b [Pseudoalteromonas viridis]|uniref:Cytochrome b n=1 Tax=Pseudoalteromonas viridis TaxID=339617 RepID=A0ABX7VA35_9GAMM|nr:cytochrome b [Pseudoalteromonas viridis]QTL37778.1 cytochrome b [Pseudoalteromonas viridis]
MSIKNTARDYGTIAKWLHWGTALLFLAAYVSVYYRQWFTEAKTPQNWTALQLHLSFGVSIAVIVALRLIWRWLNTQPTAEPGTRIEHLAAHLGHYALYAVMIIAPLTGYIGTGVDTEFFFLFDIPKFESTALFTALVEQGMGLSFAEFEKPIDFIHKEILGAWLIWILILGHIAAALYHHLVKRDRTLLKMTHGGEH